jgi:uncharacterized glyoxalase superfamily protein PhnB
MKLGYTIIYVADVSATLAFYERAFGLKVRFVDESNQYGELETGSTALAFASEACAESNGVVFSRNSRSRPAAGFSISLVTESVDTAYAHACASGAASAQKPQEKPWGQRVAYVRDLNGVLVELCSPIG